MEKNKRPRWGHSQSPSIDGMVPSNRGLGVPPKSYQPSRGRPTPSLDSFSSRKDGFHPAQPMNHGDQAEQEEAHLLDEPIELDHIESKPKKPHKGKKKKGGLVKKTFKFAALTLVIAVLGAAGYFGYKLYNTQKKVLAGGGKSVTVCSDNVDTALLKKEGDSRINILLLGNGGPGHDGADLTDTIMLASIDPINDKAVLMSIPRDLWVKIPGDGYQKINAAYADGKSQSNSKTDAGQTADGVALLDKTLQPVLDGVHVNYHVLLDFSAFKQIVDNLGGVTVNVPETLYDPTIAWENHWNAVIAKKGVQTFNGKQALLYARSRETSSDFARGERQRLLIAAIKEKALSAGTYTNPIKISSLLDSLGSNVYTDFSSNDLKCLYHQTSTIPSSAMQSLDFVTPPNELLTTGNMNGLSIVRPRAGLFDYSDMQSYLRSSLPDGLIVKENAGVAVYNATSTPGLATAETKILKEYGYIVVKTDNATNPTNPNKTIVVDLSGGKNPYTKHYLENRFGVTVVKKVPSELGITPPPNAKFVIILGEDVSLPTE